MLQCAAARHEKRMVSDIISAYTLRLNLLAVPRISAYSPRKKRPSDNAPRIWCLVGSTYFFVYCAVASGICALAL
jgi:hypothetical protein